MLKNTNSNNIISFDKVSKNFESSVGLRNVSFTVARDEFVCIVGPSGCGKSTVLKIIAGIVEPTAGNVTSPDNVSMVFQSGALLPWFTVYENVALALEPLKLSNRKIAELSQKYLVMMGLKDYMKKYPRELSGGQRQRVGIARALVINPDVLLLDEPFSALDPKTTHELHEDVVKIWQQTKQTIVMISHLIEEAVSLSQRVILMKNFTVAKSFEITLARPRREQAENFTRVVSEIRKDFFK